MVSATTFQECDIKACNFGEDVKFGRKNSGERFIDFKCGIGQIRCGTIDQCIESDFICDYEMVTLMLL
jgi:hypothetical protein